MLVMATQPNKNFDATSMPKGLSKVSGPKMKGGVQSGISASQDDALLKDATVHSGSNPLPAWGMSEQQGAPKATAVPTPGGSRPMAGKLKGDNMSARNDARLA